MPRRHERPLPGERIRRPDIASILQLQRSAGNRAVSRALLLRMRVFDGAMSEVARLPAGHMWCQATDGDEEVWIREDCLMTFMETLPGFRLTGKAEEGTAAAPPPVAADAERGGEKKEGGLGTSYGDSHLITFSAAVPGKKQTRFSELVDPRLKEPAPVGVVAELAMKHFPGTITKVRYRVPAATRTHFEIICTAEVESEEESERLYIKFDFTSSGYRMIYDASEDSGGLQTRATARVNVPVAEAMRRFTEVATRGGSYEDGRNTCGTFARAFYEGLTGEDPERASSNFELAAFKTT